MTSPSNNQTDADMGYSHRGFAAPLEIFDAWSVVSCSVTTFCGLVAPVFARHMRCPLRRFVSVPVPTEIG